MSDSYRLRVVSEDGRVFDAGYDLPRVSGIIDRVWSASFQAASHWGYNLAVEALRPRTVERTKQTLRQKGLDPRSRTELRSGEGTRVHSYLHRLATLPEGEDVSGPSDAYESAVLDFWNRFKVASVVSAERRVISLSGRYAGTLDLAVFDHTGAPWILDLKTRPRLDWRVKDMLQVAAYIGAWNEMFEGFQITKGGVLLASDTGAWRVRPVDLPTYSRAWIGTLEAYNALNGSGRGV